MKRAWAVAVVALLCVAAAAAQDNKSPEKSSAAGDAAKYFFVFLNRPAGAPTYDAAKSQEIQDGHMANIRRLYGEHKMEIAGPMMDDTKLRGIFVFKAASAEDVKQWVATDPAVKAGRLAPDVHPWTIAKGEIGHPPPNTGMEQNAMVIYHWSDKAKSMTQAAVQAAFMDHMKYQVAQFEAGKSLIGGPFGDFDKGGEYIGVVVAKGSPEDGQAFGEADPLVKSGVATVEVHGWATAKGVLGNSR